MTDGGGTIESERAMMPGRRVDRIYRDARGRLARTTTTPFRQWAWHEKVIERLYRATHNGQIRTLVIREKAANMHRKDAKREVITPANDVHST